MQLPLANRFLPLAWFLLLIPVGLYAFIALRYVENIPWFDDVEMFVMFIQDFYKADTLHNKVYWLLKPNNEHRILFAKLTTLLTYLTTGHMNFRGMILIGNLFLFGTLWLLYLVFRSMRLSIWAFVPVPFILLHPQYYMTISWSITSLQHSVVLCLACSVMYMLALGGQKRFVAAIPLQLLASLTMSNALFGWISGSVILWRQGHYKRLAIWAGLGVLTMILYVQGYTNAQGHSQSVTFLLTKPHMVVVGILTFIGGSFDFLPSLPLLWRGILPTVGGLVLVIITVWLLSRMRWPFQGQTTPPDNRSARVINQNFFVGCYGILFINTVAVGLLRMRYGYDVMLVSNYMIYPALLVCLLYLHGLQELTGAGQANPRGVCWYRTGVVVGVLIWASAYFWHLPEMAYRNRFVRAYAYNQQHNGIGLGGMSGTPLERYIQDAFNGAVEGGYYQFPESPVAGYPVRKPLIYSRAEKQNGMYRLEGAGLPGSVREAYAVLQSPGHTYLVPAKNPYRLPTFWLNRPVAILQAELRASDLRPGTYRVGWARASATDKSIQFSDQTFTVPPPL